MPPAVSQVAAKIPPVNGAEEWGTFKDSLRAPVHNWFAYPAGFSYKAVAYSMAAHDIRAGMTIYDPFMGTGTVNVAAKARGVNSCGVEAHPFVFDIARTKLNWEIGEGAVNNALRRVVDAAVVMRRSKRVIVNGEMPALVVKCYAPDTLRDLVCLRDAIAAETKGAMRRFLRVALTATLRRVAAVATGWPYIAPNKRRPSSANKDALKEFAAQAAKMAGDLRLAREKANGWKGGIHDIYNADARDTSALFAAESADHIFTSPPYLNNYDYADRTRLELYFFGIAENWGAISKKIRSRLMTAATTQITRNGKRYDLSDALCRDCPAVAEFLSSAIAELSRRRLQKSGRKDYDCMVGGYFNDIHLALRDVFRVLKSGAAAVFVLGDSAPYGVHIPTDTLVGEIAEGVGFSSFEIKELRKRGNKWRANPQRHSVALRESIVTLWKW
jgi:hypothetical protein